VYYHITEKKGLQGQNVLKFRKKLPNPLQFFWGSGIVYDRMKWQFDICEERRPQKYGNSGKN
jgi:hypothetical protein